MKKLDIVLFQKFCTDFIAAVESMIIWIHTNMQQNKLVRITQILS